MNGRHQRIYRGHLISIDVTRRGDLVNVQITTRSMENGNAGPSASYSEYFSLDLLGKASGRIRTSLDNWLSDHDRHEVAS